MNGPEEPTMPIAADASHPRAADHARSTNAAPANMVGNASPVILIVDDEPSILSALKRLLRTARYQVVTADSGAAGLDVLAAGDVDLIVSDMRMPGMTGAEFLARAQTLRPDTMRVLLTGYSEIDAVVSAINEGGVYRYLNKPWDDHDLLLTVKQALEQRRLRQETARLFAITQKQNEALVAFSTELEAQVHARTEEIRQTVMFLEDAQRDLKRNFMTMIQVGANMIELRCGVMGGESRRIGELAKRLALAFDMSELQARDLHFAGLLHGIGKLSLPDELLRKSIDRMSAEESRQFHQHALRAQMVLTPVTQLNHVAHVIRHQYERFNGRGTPDGLAGEDIPLGSRILAVARDYEGLQRGGIVNHRLLPDQAIALIQSQAGMRYDPQIVDRFVALAKDLATFGCNTPYAQITGGQLLEGMRLADDLRTSRGVLLMTKGSVVSAHQVALVRRYEAQEATPFTILIQTPPPNADAAAASMREG
ncbi:MULTISPECIES: HD domain-containing phosphohydrolase [Burkholderia]|uniref:HD domain-containing phosphohydrolase n=1 Tax=Burkholderia TaxID=32008 RepID=UPI00075F4EB4|nr:MULTISPECIES: HD domain-containing phosphohydrolase [Burkholderia]AOJ69895.1 two-component system response regulator [Burkholderia savannae]KVG41268.1 two-component system response regulator [Burkholderia sp. MSMB0265]KVG84472.1 two-component system response regulator [Burkholderia sp. MSMB2040]KVG95568.1 two-component system response regulator [Burkholderia sp. MSMB2041]KVH01276.1 two-component system response regulator [Burkholderia sp. MSMB2042]